MNPTAPSNSISDSQFYVGRDSGLNVSFCRVLVIFTAFIVFLVATSLITVVTHQRSKHSGQIQKQLFNQVTTTVAQSLEHHLSTENWPEIRRLVGKMMDHSPSVQSVQLLDANDKVLFVRHRNNLVSNENSPKAVTSSTQTVNLETPLLAATAPIFDEKNQQIGNLVAKFNPNESVITEQSGAAFLIVTAVFLGSICIGLTFWLSRKISAPVERVIQGAKELSTCNFKMRLAPTRQRELNTLIDSFNSLAKELAESTVSQNYVRSIFDSISEGLVILDRQGAIESANPAFFDMTGIKRSQLSKLKMVDILKEKISGEAVTQSDLDGEFLLKVGRDQYIPVAISCTVRKEENDDAGTVLVIKDIREQIQTQEQLMRLADFDTLTGARNRRSFHENWSEYQSHIRQESSEVSVGLIMLDVDYFKRINDVRGHAAGDEVLSGIGRILNEEVGDGGLVCRYGGEEFCLLLFNKTEDQTFEFAEGLRRKIAKSHFVFAGRSIKVTCTFGIAADEADQVVLEELTNEADQILTQTKRISRNKVGVASNIEAAPARPERNETPIESYVTLIPTVYESRRVQEVQDFVELDESEWCLVIDQKGNYVGCLEKTNLLELDSKHKKEAIGEFADSSIPTFETGTPAGMVASFMDRCKPPIVVITNCSGTSNICKPIGFVGADFSEMFRQQFDSKKAMAATV